VFGVDDVVLALAEEGVWEDLCCGCDRAGLFGAVAAVIAGSTVIDEDLHEDGGVMSRVGNGTKVTLGEDSGEYNDKVDGFFDNVRAGDGGVGGRRMVGILGRAGGSQRCCGRTRRGGVC
jgi:hypothetical protein